MQNINKIEKSKQIKDKPPYKPYFMDYKFQLIMCKKTLRSVVNNIPIPNSPTPS